LGLPSGHGSVGWSEIGKDDLIHAEQPELIVDIVRNVLDMGIGPN